MKFSRLCEFLQRLEDTPKRLEITSILAELIAELEPEETDIALYLSSGYLRAPFESEKFNIAEKMVIRIFASAYATKENSDILEKIQKLYSENGDLGSVAYELTPVHKASNITISEIHARFVEIAQSEGSGSQELKVAKTAKLLKELDKLSAKFAIRIILGTTRLGFTELTVLDALSNLLKKDKSLREEIEGVYSIHPDIGLIAKLIKTKGIKGLKDITIETGVPVLSQKAQRLEGGMDEVIGKMGVVWAEFKFDGTRVQLHMDKNKQVKNKESEQTSLFGGDKSKILLKTFTRNLEETTHQYPDLVEAAKKQIKADSVILDGEAIGYNKETGAFLPFQETIQRKRKHNVEELAKTIPLKYFVFDILYLNGKSMIDKTLRERKAILTKIVGKGETIVVDDYLETDEFEKLKEYYDVAVAKNLEGLIVKKPGDSYQAGARTHSWVKLKRADQTLIQDSMDCVVLGYYYGKGVRSKFGIGGFLVGIYDEKNETFKTVTKVGTGLKDEDWVKLKSMADKYVVTKIPANVEIHKIFKPDVILAPKIVVEIGADEISVSPTHSTGYALRFPRLINFREDKRAEEATTIKELSGMFKAQKVKKG